MIRTSHFHPKSLYGGSPTFVFLPTKRWLNLIKFFIFGSNLQKWVPNHDPKEDAQACTLAPIFGDLSQSGKLSEIKPPLLLGLQFFNIFHEKNMTPTF